MVFIHELCSNCKVVHQSWTYWWLATPSESYTANVAILCWSGHNNYTKCCRLYLQDSLELCPCLEGPMHEGYFAVRRNEKVYWQKITLLFLQVCFVHWQKQMCYLRAGFPNCPIGQKRVGKNKIFSCSFYYRFVFNSFNTFNVLNRNCHFSS